MSEKGFFAGMANPMRNADGIAELEERIGVTLPGKDSDGKFFYYVFPGDEPGVCRGVQATFDSGWTFRVFRESGEDVSGIWGGRELFRSTYDGVSIRVLTYGDIVYSVFSAGGLSCSCTVEDAAPINIVSASLRVIRKIRK